MGAFFLFKNKTDINKNAVEEIFLNKGFQQPRIFKLNNLTLWLYNKQLIKEDNYFNENDGTYLFATGTVIYRSLSYRKSLKAILKDYRNNVLSFDELIGDFCLIFYSNNEVKVLTDRACIHHVFIDDKHTRLSSSFLAVLASFNYPQQINRLAFFEKMSIGFIISPETLVQSIKQINPRLQRELVNLPFSFIKIPENKIDIAPCSGGFDQCIELQLDGLRNYFKRFSSLAEEYGTDLGLSSGYDSRLVFLLCKSLDIPISTHTHLTSGSPHRIDYEIVKQITNKTNTVLNVFETKQIFKHSEYEIESIFKDCLYYYDGRNSNNMGAFNETYTRLYKVKTLTTNGLSLNGQGGEIYRNYYYTSRKRFSFYPWFRNHCYYHPTEYAIQNKKIWDQTYQNIRGKIESILDVDLKSKIDLKTMRRFYGSIIIPECEGSINNAHNQLSFFLTPFMDQEIIRRSESLLPYLGLGGNFEANMIKKLDPEIASLQSHYGFSFMNEPFKHLMTSFIKGYTPDRLWILRNNLIIKYKSQKFSVYNNYKDLLKRSKTIQDSNEALNTFFPEQDWHFLARDNTSIRTLTYIGYFLKEFGSKLRINAN